METGTSMVQMKNMLLLPASLLLLHALVCSACITDGENSTSVCDESADLKAVCSGRNLTTVPQDINCATITLDLSLNAITVLLGNVFRNLSSLTSLSLVSNGLEEIQLDAFAGLSSLLELDLRKNRLDQWPDFSDACNTLTYVNLEYNFLSQASNGLECLLSLEDLDLSENELVSFPNISAVGDTLKKLHLNWNRYLEIKEADLIPFKAIEFIDVNHILVFNSCSVFDILNSTVLKVHVAATAVTELEDCNFRYKTTELWYHHIKHISALPESCVLVTGIMLIRGSLSTIDDDAFDNCVTIESLRLYENELTKFPKLTGMKETLTYLDLETNQINEINADWLNELTKLETLYLSINKLSSIPNVPGPSQSLSYLDLHINAFTSFPELDVIGASIEELNLANNRGITAIFERNLAGLHKLQTLSLAETSITGIPAFSFVPASMQSMILDNSPVTTFSPAFMVRIPTTLTISLMNTNITILPSSCGPFTSSLDLRGSPVDLCNCRMLWLKLINDTSGITVDPAECSGRPWSASSYQQIQEVCMMTEEQGAGRIKEAFLVSLPNISGCPVPTTADVYSGLTRTQCAFRCLKHHGCMGINFSRSSSSSSPPTGRCSLVAAGPLSSPDTVLPMGSDVNDEPWKYYPLNE